jgi:hypothetical protein
MSYLPELRASLVRAAARDAATPRRRQRGFVWLPLTLAAGVAVAVVAVAVVLVGHRAPSGGTPPAHPNGAAPPPMPNPSVAEWNLIVKARRETVARDSACSPFVSRPPFSAGEPSRALTAILGVLRRPASEADTAPLHFFEHGPPDIYRSAIRLVREKDGLALYVVPTANVMGWKPVPRRCAAEEAAVLDRQMKYAPAKQRAAALDVQRRYLAWQQYEAQHPQGVCLTEIDSAPQGRGRRPDGGGVACGWGVAEIEQGLAGLGQTDSPGPSFFHGIVPDGIASVDLELPRHLGTVTAKVVDNLYLAPIPRYIQAPVRVVWRAADGRVIRTTRVP